jgi:hypothetical protein
MRMVSLKPLFIASCSTRGGNHHIYYCSSGCSFLNVFCAVSVIGLLAIDATYKNKKILLLLLLLLNNLPGGTENATKNLSG